jgi:hypothetical protein
MAGSNSSPARPSSSAGGWVQDDWSAPPRPFDSTWVSILTLLLVGGRIILSFT